MNHCEPELPGVTPFADGDSHSALAEALDRAYCVVDILLDEAGAPADYRFVYVNPLFQAFTGIAPEVALSGRSAREIIPGLEPFWVETYAKVAVTGEPANFEASSEALGRFFEVRAFRLDDRLRRVGILFADVTAGRAAQEERMRLATELETERNRLRAMLENAPAFLAVLRGRDLVFEHVNTAYYQIVGHRPILGLPLAEAIPEAVGGDEGRDYDRLLLEIMDRGESITFQGRPVHLQRSPGAELEQRFLDLSYEPLRNDNGEVDGVLVLGIDVTERMRSRQALVESERRFRRVVEAGPVPMAFFRLDGRYSDCNDAFCRLLGFSREEILSGQVKWTELTPPEWMPRTREALEELAKSGRVSPYEKEYFRKDGSRFWGLFGGSVLSEDEGLMYLLDVTESRRAEEMLRSTADALPAFLAYMDDGLVYRFCNRTYEEAFQRSRDEILGRTSREVLGAEASAHIEPLLRRALIGEHVREARWLTFPGFGRRFVRIDYKPRRDRLGRVEGVFVLAVDETMQIEIQEALRESEVRYRSLFETSPQPMWVYDTSTLDFLEVNGAAIHQYGYSREEFLTMKVTDIRPEEDGDRLRQVIEDGAGKSMTYYGGWRHRRKDGTELIAEIVSQPTEFGDRPARLVLAQDVTARLELERALSESAAQYEQIAEGLPQLVWTADHLGVRDYFNARWVEYTGLDLAQDDNPWLHSLHPEDAHGAVLVWQAAVAEGKPFQAQYRLRGRDGRYRWFLGRAIPLKNEAGAIVRWFGTCTDVHEQRSAQEALEISNEFATTLAQDLDLGRIVQTLCDACTQAVGAQFGSFFYNVVNQEGESYMLYTLSGAPREAFNFGMPRATEVFGPTFRNEGIVRSEDITQDPRYGRMGAPHHGMPKGHLPVVSYLAVPVVSRSGEVIGGLFFGHPERAMFSEEHETIVSAFAAQAAVAMDNARLYDQVRTMNQDLERKVEERTSGLLSANERLQGFTYHVSHDLRAPLRAISSTSHVVLEDFGDQLGEDARELLLRQSASADRLGQLIDDLLKLSRIDRIEMSLQEVDLTALARDAADEALSMHPYSCVKIEVRNGLTAQADPRLLRLALLNLVENGVKYSPEGGTVRVGQREDGAYLVSDEGIGIEERYFVKIFEPFQRLHRDEEFSGTGIGLSNVAQVIERHGGRLWVESELGKGSTFLFTLPKPG